MKTRPAKAAIGVVNIKNVKLHKPWLEQGRYKIVVAVDWENMDFTLLEIAHNAISRALQSWNMSFKRPQMAIFFE